MSRFTAGAVRFAGICPRAILIVAFSLLSSAALSAATPPAAPQLLPYTVTTVAGGGTSGATAVVTTYNPTASPFTVGAACAAGSSLKATDTAGDGCLATQVMLSVPRGAAADSEGNLFIVDSNNQSIRRVDAHTGIITTIAGSGTGAPVYPAKGAACAAGSNLTATSAFGDGCLATQITLAAPEGITLDAEGNVWFTDYYLGSVREVSKSTGIINTIVNTTGTVGYKADNAAYTATGIAAANGLLYHPYGLTFDRQGNLYIADNYNNVVDVVNLGSTTATIAGYKVGAGEIFTITGSGCPYVSQPESTSESNTSSCYSDYGHPSATAPPGLSTSAQLDSPYQVAVDNSGNIYIADEYPYDVRVINGTTGLISYFAGVASSHMPITATLARGVASSTPLGSIYGVATDSLGNVYISLFQSPLSIIARVDIATGEIYPIAGQYDSAVPTAYNGTVSPAGVTGYCAGTTDLVGDGCPGTKATFWRPYQPFVDAAGNVYVTDQDNFLIRKLSVGTQFPATASGASITQSVDIHFGAGDGPATSSPYTLPSGFNEFSIGTPACTTNSDTTQDCVLPVKFTPATAGVRSAPLTVTSAGKLVSNFSLTGTGLAPVLAIDPGTQATIAPTGANAALTGVSGIALDDAGDVFATVPAANTLYEVNFSGTETNLGSGFSSATANAVALDAAGNVYAALSNGSIEKLPGGNAASATPLASGFTAPSGIAVDSFGNVYVTDVDAKTVSEILAGTGVQLVLPMPSLGGPTGVAVDTFGNVFVADSVNNDVVELPFNGSEAVKLGAGLDAPLGLAVDPAGSLYIADSKNSRIVFIPNEGAPNTSTLNTADQIAIIAKLGTPTGIAVAGSGTVYVADSYANSIYTFTRNAASINLGNALTAIGAESSATNTAVADIVSMGTKPAAFGSAFATASGSNTADFSLSPSSIPVSSDFPNAGFGLTLTAGFTPTALGSRSAEYTFGATNVTQPTLSLSGAGIQPHDITTTTVVSTPPSGQTNWTYGQTVTVNITVSVNSGLPAPTGNVSVYVDGGSTAASTPQLTAGNASSIASIAFPGLSAGPHTFTASYGGDTESSASSSTLLTLNVATAPLTVTVNNLSNPFDAPLPTLTGVLTGVQNGDQIGVNYTTTATAASLVGQYPINATVTGSAVGSYSVTVNPGTLSVTQDSTVTTVGVSATSVNPATQVTLTASVGNQNNYAIVSIPTGSVTFFNTVGATQTQIGTATLNSSGVATYQATFAVAGQTANNMVTAVYSGDPNFLTSTSAGIAVVSGAPTFSLTSSPNSSVTVAPGQSGLMSFNLVPAFGYNGTIGFSCTGATATVSCSFSPATVTADGSNTGSLIAVTINTQQPGSPLASSKRPNGNIAGGKLPMSLAVIPGLALLFGFSGLRRKFLRGYRSLLFVALCLAGLGFTGCGAAKLTTGTPAGNQTITVVATGTGGSFASVTQQFTVTLTVQ